MRNTSEKIRQFNSDRDPQTIALKYAAMREGPFRFFRGTCHLFYEDLHRDKSFPKSPPAWLCGDLHLENFGSFKGSDRLAYFDLNDFDESILGPALWELARLLTSAAVACIDAGKSLSSADPMLNRLVDSYCKTLIAGKPVTMERETATGLIKELFEEVATRKKQKLVKERADAKSGYIKLLIDNRRTFPVSQSVKKELSKSVQAWLDTRHGKGDRKVRDICSAVVGTGSIGVKRYLILVEKPALAKKYLLTIKQALPSSLKPFLEVKQPVWKNEADRERNIQFRMQHVTPGDLDTFSFKGDWYITKWMQPIADKINLVNFIKEKEKQADLMASLGGLLASAQLRSSGRQGSAITDELIRFGSDAKWKKNLIGFARQYTTVVQKDYKEYCGYYDKGYFKAQQHK